MTTPDRPAEPPLAEPGARPSGSDVGGVRGASERGVADAAQRSSQDERPAPATRPPSAGSAAPARPGAAINADDEDEWRHPPVAPADERNPLRSLGKAVSDTLTNAVDGTPETPER